jgi:hypothetical protein
MTALGVVLIVLLIIAAILAAASLLDVPYSHRLLAAAVLLVAIELIIRSLT